MSRAPELPPLEPTAPEIGEPARVAGGIPAIKQSLAHVVRESGLIRGSAQLLAVNQKSGFDCPGCAWPDPDDRREITEFCENGAKAVAEETTTKRVTPETFARHSVAELAAMSDHEIGKLGRITHPVVLREGATHYAPIAWAEAFALIARELNALTSPNEAVFYTSGRTSNEAAFAYQTFVRLYGTNNLPDCSNMCHESSGVALKQSIGVAKGTVTLEDFDHADCIMVIGQNPGTNHPRMLTTLQRAARRGASVISVNPLFETGLKAFTHPQHFWRWLGSGTEVAKLHLPVRVGGDVALLSGLMKQLIAMNALDRAFIAAKTHGFEQLEASLADTQWDDIVRESGVTRALIDEAANILAKSKATICCWAMGLTQQTHGVAAIQYVANLLLLGGHLGRQGAGACPVRGHSNVQGDRTMGIYEKPSPGFLAALGHELGVALPEAHGYDTVDAIRAMHDGRAKVFFAMGGNFLSATPDTTFTAEALRRTRLTVQVSTKLNRSHLVHGRVALILPCLARSDRDEQASGEQIISTENSMSVVQPSRGALAPPSEHVKSEVAIVCDLARAVLPPSQRGAVDWAGWCAAYDRIRDSIERVIPGFERYNERLRESVGFYLPNPVRDSQTFATPSGRAQFTVYPLPRTELGSEQLVLMTLRSHDQFNTTIYGLDDRYRGIKNGRRVVFLNQADIRARGLASGQYVDIVSHFGTSTRRADRFMVVPYEIPERCAAAYFPEANVLVPVDSVVPGSNTPTYKSIIVTLEPSRA
ncbi:MAG TPA: FdhF/YdeP family oxidoreductase [Myxococcota bacterium]|nr:FdhF/YdeP family oxidoreductase [Myxococcota bacterium]